MSNQAQAHQVLSFRPRAGRPEAVGLAAGRRARLAGGTALDVAYADCEARFGAAYQINSHKRRVEALIRKSFGSAEVRAYFQHFIELFITNAVSLDEACDFIRFAKDKCAAGRVSTRARSYITVRSELHLILRWLRAKGMHAEFAETVAGLRQPQLEAAE